MLRLAASTLAFVALAVAVLWPVASASAQVHCPGPASDEDLTQRIRDSDLVVLGDVVDAVSGPGEDRATLRLRPIAYFKGNPSAALISFNLTLPGPCLNPGIYAGPGTRLVVMAKSSGGSVPFPEPERAYLIDSASGVTLALALNRGDTLILPADTLFTRIRSITNQLSVPAESKEEGAGIDWLTTVLPVLGALAFIGGAGFILMRIWHRIDPS